jgi:SAM-dependent methyltransferase
MRRIAGQTWSQTKEWLKAVPGLVPAKRAVWTGARTAWSFADEKVHADRHFVVRNLGMFSPNSAGPLKTRADLTVLAANQVFPLLATLLRMTDGDPVLEPAHPSALFRHAGSTADDELKALFNFHGSDKATDHDLHTIYGPILSNRDAIEGVLEIGLGSNNLDVISNMGGTGQPGASLRAFRDFLPRAQIFGADIDRRVLFAERRIATFWVDQTKLETFSSLSEKLPTELDLIIDDGLHAPNANLAVLIFALNRLRKGGWLVIEDILPSALPLWQLVAWMLHAQYERHIAIDRTRLVFLVQRLHGTARGA